MGLKTTIMGMLLGCALALTSCSKPVEKPKYIWIAVDANFQRFSDRDTIDFYLDKIRETGFNWVVVDVRGVTGEVRCKSDFEPQLTSWEGFTAETDWDYLQYFIDATHKRNMKISVAKTIFPLGCPMVHQGAVYDNPELKRLTCLEYTPQGFLKIEDDSSQVAAFMNPSLPEAREYAMRQIRETFEKYDFDGFALDYCRYPGATADFSDFTRGEFEKYLGKKVGNWPGDIFTYGKDGEIVPGEYYREWWYFRSKTIRDFIAEVKAYKDSVKPEVELEYWAASWLHAIYRNGQNWAAPSARYYEGMSWATEDYCDTGFADQLDVFMTGTYLERIWGEDDPESIEYGINRSIRDTDGACRMLASFQVCTDFDIEDATYICLSRTDGVMVFDISHMFAKPESWDAVKRGIDRAEKEMRTK